MGFSAVICVHPLLHVFVVSFLPSFPDQSIVFCEYFCFQLQFSNKFKNFIMLLRIMWLQLKEIFLYGGVIQSEEGFKKWCGEFLWRSLVHFVLKDACVCKLDITWGSSYFECENVIVCIKTFGLWVAIDYLPPKKKKKSLRSRVWIECNVTCRIEFEGKGAFTKVSSVCNSYC